MTRSLLRGIRPPSSHRYRKPEVCSIWEYCGVSFSPLSQSHGDAMAASTAVLVQPAECGCALGRGTATGHPVSGEERRLADAVCAVAAGVGVPTAPPPSRVVPVWRDAPRTAPHRTAQDFVRVTTGCTFREAATAVRVSLRLRAHRRAGHAEHLCVEAGSPTRLVWMTDPETAAGVTNLCDRAISPRRGGPRFVGGDDATTADRLLDDSHSDPVDITTIERLACTRQTDRHTQTDTLRRTHSDGHTRQCRDPPGRRPGTPPQHQTATPALEKPRTHRTPPEENRKNGGRETAAPETTTDQAAARLRTRRRRGGLS